MGSLRTIRSADIKQRRLDEALFQAIEADDIEKVLLLLDMGADLEAFSDCGLNPLMWAAHPSSLHIMRLLIDRGAQIDAQDESGMTPLMWAAEQEECWPAYKPLELLLECGANVNIQSRKGYTALMFAAQQASSGPFAGF